MYFFRAEELCESRSGRPGLPVRNSPYGLCGRNAALNGFFFLFFFISIELDHSGQRSELQSCVKVEVDVLGSPSLIVFMVSVDVKQH